MDDDIKQDLVQLRIQIMDRLSTPGLSVQERAELVVALNLIKNQIRFSKKSGGMVK